MKTEGDRLRHSCATKGADKQTTAQNNSRTSGVNNTGATKNTEQRNNTQYNMVGSAKQTVVLDLGSATRSTATKGTDKRATAQNNSRSKGANNTGTTKNTEQRNNTQYNMVGSGKQTVVVDRGSANTSPSTKETNKHLDRGSANSSTAAKATDKQSKSQKNTHSSGLNGNASSLRMQSSQSKNEDLFANLALERVASKIAPATNLKKPLSHGVSPGNDLSGEPHAC